MENFKYSINNISSQIFHIKKVNSELKASLETIKEFWKQFEGMPNIVPNDLKPVVNNLFMIVFKNSAVKDKYINKLTYMLKTVKIEDKVKIRHIQEMSAEVQRLYEEDAIIGKTISAIIKELNLSCCKELERRSKR